MNECPCVKAEKPVAPCVDGCRHFGGRGQCLNCGFGERGCEHGRAPDQCVPCLRRRVAELEAVAARLRNDVHAAVDVMVDHNISVPEQFKTFGKLAEVQATAARRLELLRPFALVFDPPRHQYETIAVSTKDCRAAAAEVAASLLGVDSP